MRGDGAHTVSELIEITNSDPRRGIGHEKVLTRITVDEAVLALLEKHGLTLDSVPTPGQFVQLRLGARIYDGIPQNDLQNRKLFFAQLHGFF